MKRLNIIVLIALTIQILLGSFVVNANETSKNDIAGHWAETTIKAWLDKELVNGYSDGSFKPNASITRAEFVKMINRVFQVPASEAALQYADLPQSHWAYGEIAAAVQAGYVSGTSETNVSPDAIITRQEAAVMLVKLTKLEGTAELNFKDEAAIPQWSRKAIAALVAGGFMKGDPSGNFRAKDGLTRAEAVVLIDNVNNGLETVFDQAGEYGSKEQAAVIQGDVRITAAGVTLRNTEIKGDLIIDETVGEGDVYLQHVKVHGTTLVNGGGENSLHLEDTVLLRLIVDKATGKVRIVASGATSVEQVAVQSPVKLEESQNSETGFKNIELTSALPAGSNVELVGHFENVAVMAASIQVKVPSGSINQLSVGERASNNTVALDKSVTVEKLVLAVVAKLVGEGTINQAQVTKAAESSTFETKPKQLDVVDANGKPLPSPTPTPELIPEIPSNPNPTPTATVKPTPTPVEKLSDDATIHSLTVNDGLVLNKQNWEGNFNDSIAGFAKEHFEYTVDLPADQQSLEFKLNIETEKNAEVYYYVEQEESERRYEAEKASDKQFVLTVDTKKETVIRVSITSESGKFAQEYKIYLIGGWDVQSTFKLKKPSDHSYSIQSGLLKVGDELTITIPAEHSAKGQELIITETVDKYSSYPKGTYTAVSYGIDTDFAPSSNKGELGLKLVRDGKTIYDGKYEFDVTPLNYVELENPLENKLFNFSFVTKEYLDAWNENEYSYEKFAYEYTVDSEEEEIKKVYGAAKYWYVSITNQGQFADNEQFVADSIKPTRNYDLMRNWGLNNGFGGVEFYNEIEGKEQYEVATGQIVRVHLYDENLQMIQALIMKFEVPEQYLASNVVPKEIITEDDLGDASVTLKSASAVGIEWRKVVYPFTELTGVKTAGFEPNFDSYIGLFDQSMVGEAITLQFDAVKGLDLSLTVGETDRATNQMEYILGYHDQEVRNGVKLNLKENTDYNINVTVTNPYTNESETYFFSLNSKRSIDEAFTWNKRGIQSSILQAGDLLEITLSADDNITGQPYVLSYKATENPDVPVGSYLSSVQFDLKQQDDKLKDLIAFEPKNDTGAIAIKLTRQGKVVYQGSVQYDFTALKKLDGAALHLFNDPAREDYLNLNPKELRWDVMYEKDFSNVEDAAYVARFIINPNLSSPFLDNSIVPTVQDLSINRKLQALDEDKKFIQGMQYSRPQELQKYMHFVYIVYDANKNPLGYTVLTGELSDENVSDNISIIE